MHHGWAPEIIDEHLHKTASSVLLPPPQVAVQINGTDQCGLFNDNRKKRKWGIVCIIFPFALLFLILIAYAVNSFVISNAMSNNPPVGVQNFGGTDVRLSAPATGLGEQDKRAVAAQITNVALSLLGLLAFLGIFVLVPIGIVLIANSRRELKPGVAYDERSGKGDASIIPAELGNWNWGAAFLTLWWGIYYRVWIALLIFVPVIGSFWWIVMGIKGNEWAWQKNKWLSIEYFKKAQRKWMPWAIALLAMSILSGLVVASLIVTSAARFGTVQQLNPVEGLSGYNKVSGAPLGIEAMNATYVINGQPVKLVNGTSVSHPADSSAGVTDLPATATTGYFGETAYGDLNGDGMDDMVFVMWQETGGSGTFYYLAVAFAHPNGAAPGTDTIFLGDRIKPVSTEIKSDLVVVTYLDRKPDEPMTTAPSVTVVRNFKILDEKLEEIK